MIATTTMAAATTAPIAIHGADLRTRRVSDAIGTPAGYLRPRFSFHSTSTSFVVRMWNVSEMSRVRTSSGAETL